MTETADKESYLLTIINLAKSSGFFSTWMEIFKDEEEVREALIRSFQGTRSSCFEVNIEDSTNGIT